MLIELRETGEIEVSPKARRVFPELRLNKENPGVMAGYQLTWDAIGGDDNFTAIPNPASDDDCPTAWNRCLPVAL
jgi:hypothetical protein